MKNAKHIWWRMGGGALIGLGLITYFLWQKNRKQAKVKSPLGSKVTPTKNSPVVIESRPSKGTNKVVTINEPNWSDPFDANYVQDVKRWISPQKILELPPELARQYAQKIHKAKGGTWYKNDDEKAVSTVFVKQLKDKVQVANLSLAFWKLYHKDLWQYLTSFLSAREMEKYVGKPVRQLVRYRLVG